ncbi:cubilin-like isoform X1 [Haliotis cracherodii]|uniref:cubilin-like isoform X1 n=1 Tax=Haliotis cracherodii TaxID=6455 RepID=UPI0039ECC5EB
MLGIYKTVAVLLGILSSLLAASTDRCVEEIALTGDAVNITSPGYPNHYGADLTCGWKINASSPDRRVGVHIANLSLESSADCLSFYNGPDNSSRSLFQFCGTNTDTGTGSFLSSGDSMYIQFTSDSSVNAGGFRIVVIDSEKCGGTLTATSEVANLPSPGYPYTYFNDLRCTWIITAENENETVGLTTLNSDIEGTGASCPYDVLRVYTGNTIEDDQYLGESCSKQLPTYQSSKNSLLVHFTTDVSTTKQGFMLQYVARKAGDCNNTYAVKATDKYIMSPGYPDIYDSNLECFIILADVTSTSRNLKLDIVSLDVDGDFPNCGDDSVTLYQGVSGQLIGKFCGDSSNTSFGPFYSNGIFMTMVFKTNGDSSGRGFRIRVSHSERKVVPPQSKDCGPQYLNSTIHPQYLQSPGYPVELSSHKDCVWTITASNPNMMVRIDVIDSDIYSTDTSYVYCRNDRVWAYDGPSIFNDMISFWCGPSRPTLQSSGSAITIQFHSTGSSGFKLAYFETNEQYHCGGTLNITTADYTTVTSPNYPGPYPNRENCIWIIYAPANTNIEAKVRNTKIESTTPCRYDYLQIFDGMGSSVSDPGRYCGDDNIDYTSSGHIITVRFHSDSSMRHKGFQMLLKAGHFRASETMELSASYFTAYILSPNYPFNYPSNTESSWKITAGRDYTVMIEVKESSIESSFGCLSDFVEAFDGSDSNAPSLGRWCGQSEPLKTSSGSVMFLKFKSDSSGVDRGFKIKYTKEYNPSHDFDTNVGAIVGGSIGGSVLMLLIMSGIAIFIYKKNQRIPTTNVPVYYTVGQVPTVSNFGQGPMTNIMPPTNFTGPPSYATSYQPVATPSSTHLNSETLPPKF